MPENYKPKFIDFLKEVSSTSYEQNTTATGTVTIQQSVRNELRKKGVEALKTDLEWLYGEEFDVVETKEGIVIVAENEPDDFTFSWELKNTIKSLDYDPFIQANNYEEALMEKEAKRARQDAEKAAKIKALQIKRAKKLAEIERLQNLTN